MPFFLVVGLEFNLELPCYQISDNELQFGVAQVDQWLLIEWCDNKERTR